MKRIGIAFFAILAAFSLFLPISRGECYVTLKHKEVPLAFGKINLPEDMSIVEFDLASLVKRMQEDKNFQRELTLMSGNEQYKHLVTIMEYLQQPEIKDALNSLQLYQGGLYDGKSYRMVWFFTVTNNKQMQSFYGDFFKGTLTEEKIMAVEDKYQTLNEQIQEYVLGEGQVFDSSQIKKVTSKNQLDRPVLELAEISSPEFTQIRGKQAVVVQYRVAGQMMGSYGACYGKQYDFAHKNKPASFGFLCLDSERTFWQAIFDKALLDADKENGKA